MCPPCLGPSHSPSPLYFLRQICHAGSVGSSWKGFTPAVFFSFFIPLSRLGSIQISLSISWVFFLLFSAASYDFSFLADSGLEICLSSSPVLPPAVTLPVPRTCFPQARGDVLGRTRWKAAAFSVGGLPLLPNYPLNLQKAAGASAASPRGCRDSREEHWGAVPTASMQLLTLPWAFPGKKKRLRSLCQSRRDVGSASKLQPCLGLEHPPF